MFEPSDARPSSFEFAPYIAIWETTRACDLVCRHCRADAQHHRNPFELTTAEGMRVIRELADMGTRLLVLTGGDPAKREDLPKLIREGVRCGLRMSISPSATPLVTPDVLAAWRDAGVSRIAISLDGAGPPTHDRFRGVEGTFALTERLAGWIAEAGVALQIGTTLTRHSCGELEAISRLVAQWGAVLWSVFLLVPTGRATTEDLPDAPAVERALRWLAEFAQRAPFDIKTTEAYHFRRIVAQLSARRGARPSVPGRKQAAAIDLPPALRRAGAVNAGKGFLFISHTGEICPSGFLPLAAGNVRRDAITVVYRDAPLFRELRDPDRLEGKCGICEYRTSCGGSRSRAYALTGNPFAEDPACAYTPPGWRAHRARGDE